MASTSIIGGATLATIIIGIVRVKILALLTGPEGIGLLGMLVNVSGLVAAIAGLGLSAAAVREIASSTQIERRAEIRRALWAASFPLAVLGAAGLWAFRNEATSLVAADASLAFLVGLSGLAVFFSILGAAQQGVLQGLQRISALAMVKVGGAILATLIAIPAVYYQGNLGILAAVVAVPSATFLIAMLVSPGRLQTQGRTTRSSLAKDWRQLLRLGLPLTFTGVVQLLSLALLRGVVAREGGTEMAGLFQAVISITSMNITLVLGAMAADYYPRLSAANLAPRERSQIVNQQLHFALLVAAPLILGMIGAAPLVLTILYSQAFTGAEWMLRWQLLGDLFKILSWALGFVLLASGDRRAFLGVEILLTVVLLASALLLIPPLGLAGAGIAYALAYLAYSAVTLAICGKRHAVTVDTDNRRLMLGLVGAGAILILLASWNQWAAIVAGLLTSGVLALHAVRSLSLRAGISLPRLRR